MKAVVLSGWVDGVAMAVPIGRRGTNGQSCSSIIAPHRHFSVVEKSTASGIVRDVARSSCRLCAILTIKLVSLRRPTTEFRRQCDTASTHPSTAQLNVLECGWGKDEYDFRGERGGDCALAC